MPSSFQHEPRPKQPFAPTAAVQYGTVQYGSTGRMKGRSHWTALEEDQRSRQPLSSLVLRMIVQRRVVCRDECVSTGSIDRSLHACRPSEVYKPCVDAAFNTSRFTMKNAESYWEARLVPDARLLRGLHILHTLNESRGCYNVMYCFHKVPMELGWTKELSISASTMVIHESKRSPIFLWPRTLVLGVPRQIIHHHPNQLRLMDLLAPTSKTSYKCNANMPLLQHCD